MSHTILKDIEMGADTNLSYYKYYYRTTYQCWLEQTQN